MILLKRHLWTRHYCGRSCAEGLITDGLWIAARENGKMEHYW